MWREGGEGVRGDEGGSYVGVDEQDSPYLVMKES